MGTQIKTSEDLDKIADIEAGDDVLDQEPAERKARKKKESYGKETGRLDSSGKFYRGDQDSESEAEKKTGKKVRFAVSEEEPAPKKMSKKEAMKVVNGDAEHPLLTDLEDGDTNQKRKRKADQWFKKANFETIENEDDEDLELESMASKYPRLKTANRDDNLNDSDDSDADSDDMEVETREKSKAKRGKITKIAKEEVDPDSEDSEDVKESDDSDGDSDSSSDNSDYDVNEDFKENIKKGPQPAAAGKARGKKRSLTAEALALGSMMIHSQKAKRDITDDGWNRFAFNDDNLPDWFTEDERRHSHKDLPVTKELVQEYRDRMKEINVRPIKKVVEAKARKKRRATGRMERAKKKAD